MTDTIWVDFNNVDPKGRIRLNVRGALEALGRLGIVLAPGQQLVLDDGDVRMMAVVEFSQDERIWVAVPQD